MADLRRIVGQLGLALDEVEPKLAWDDLPLAALEELKITIDDVRTSLLAFMESSSPADYNRARRQFRLRRANQVCESVLDSVSMGAVDVRSSDVMELREIVDEMLEKAAGPYLESHRSRASGRAPTSTSPPLPSAPPAAGPRSRRSPWPSACGASGPRSMPDQL